MTGINFFKRLAGIALLSVMLGTIHLVAYLALPDVARYWAPPYVPMTTEELELKVRGAGDCRTFEDYFLKESGRGCTPDSGHWEREVRSTRAIHKAKWEGESLEPRRRALEIGSWILFGGLYVILLVTAATSIYQWSRGRFSGVLRLGIHGAKGGRDAIGEVLFKRRMHQTEKQFNNLKALYENGLLTEEEFLKRKSKLASALQEAAR